MTSIDPKVTAPLVQTGSPFAESAPAAPSRLRQVLENLGDYVNPILTKETRQALKSKQFGVAFVLVLTCCWLWSFCGLMVLDLEVHSGTTGPSMFMGYYVILAFPLLVVVPFGAFRSLASEREDGTYELLSISTLQPGQIVTGKLGSAVVQMLVYLSAVSPCLAFTYLLRGIDLPTILYVIGATCLASLGLSMIGLLLATSTREKYLQILLTVIVIAGLLWLFGVGIAMANAALYAPFRFLEFQSSEFWLVQLAMACVYVLYFALCLLVARAQLMFSSANRSTAIRVCLVVQQLVFTAWMAWVFIFEERELDILTVYMMFVLFNWYILGIFLTGESPELSPRVRRQLPQSFAGRLFFSWFNPGSGSGLVFTLSNVLGAVALCVGTYFVMQYVFTGNWNGRSFNDAFYRFLYTVVLGPAYLLCYLGAGRLLVLLLRRAFHLEIFVVACIHVFLLVLGCLGPWIVKNSIDAFRNFDYMLIEITNPLAIFIEVFDRRVPVEGFIVLCTVPAVATLIFCCNLPSIVRELQMVRLARPQRVLEEDAELNPPVVAEPAYVSPFDD